MTPVLVTAPTAEIVTLADMKAHLRVTHTVEDDLIEALTAAAVAYLDGWAGVLGRCIGAQTWRITYENPGTYLLPMPDVTTASAAYEAGAAVLTIKATSAGPEIEITEACAVTFTCEMSAPMAALVAQAVKLLVGHWYQNREAAGAAMSETPMAVDMILSAIRWRKF
jgi:hypothetical protein